MDQTLDDNVLQLGIIDILFQVLTLFSNLIFNVLVPGLLSPLFSSIFGIVQPAA